MQTPPQRLYGAGAGAGYLKQRKADYGQAARLALGLRGTGLNGALELVDIKLAARTAAALGAAGRGFAEKGTPENAPHVKCRAHKQGRNQQVLDFNRSEGKKHG